MNLDTLTPFMNLLEILTIVLEVMYTIFAFIIVRQVNVLRKSFLTDGDGAFLFFSRIHFFVSLALVFLSVLLLI